MEEIFFFLCHVIHILKIHPPMVLGGRIQNEVFQRIKKCRKSSLVAPLLSTSSWMRVLCFKLVLVLCTDQQRNQLSKDTLLSFDCFTQGGNKYVVQSCSILTSGLPFNVNVFCPESKGSTALWWQLASCRNKIVSRQFLQYENIFVFQWNFIWLMNLTV